MGIISSPMEHHKRDGPPEKKQRLETPRNQPPPVPLELARRPEGCGTKGRNVLLKENYYKVQLPNGSLVQYEVGLSASEKNYRGFGQSSHPGFSDF
jgi:hypothetical protein